MPVSAIHAGGTTVHQKSMDRASERAQAQRQEFKEFWVPSFSTNSSFFKDFFQVQALQVFLWFKSYCSVLCVPVYVCV
jgi:hypothetical protein